MKKNIAILMGGYSSEYAVSVKSGKVVYENLKKETDLNLFKIYITKNKWYYVNENSEKFDIDKNNFTLKINDRGPYVGDRILDCSSGAAKKLGFFDKGTANVKIEVLKWGDNKYYKN